MSTVTPTFHLFCCLPPEIRIEIYLLATPPRFVHVQEGLVDHYEEFVHHFKTSAFSLELHPSLTHFAHNWRNCLLPFGDRPPGAPGIDFLRDYPTPAQSSLERYGFTSSKPPPRQPWPATPHTPALPLRWLLNQPDLAWYFTRKSYLYSRAPIPPLLHTCSESRDALVRHGYRLAFASRTHGPRTWFHFDRDALHLNPIHWDSGQEITGDVLYEADLMCRFRYSVAQFLPEDLLRVRNLSLSGVDLRDAPQLCHFLRLFGYGVSVLYLVQCTLDEELELDQLERWDNCLHQLANPKSAHQARERFAPLIRELMDKKAEQERRKVSWDPWHAVECDELDYIPSDFHYMYSFQLPWVFAMSSDLSLHGGSRGGPFWEHKFKHPGKRTNTYFAAQGRLFADYLLELLGTSKNDSEQGWDHSESDSAFDATRPSPIFGPGDGVPGAGVPTPKVPFVRVVHLGSDGVMPYLDFNRKACAVMLDEMERLEEERGYPEWIYTDNDDDSW